MIEHIMLFCAVVIAAVLFDLYHLNSGFFPDITGNLNVSDLSQTLF